MKNLFKRPICFFLALMILLTVMPLSSLAADNELVLTSIDHTAAVSAVNVSAGTSVTLTVPYTHAATVDLSSGLDITYNTTVYSSAIAAFLSGSVATVDGGPVNMTVTYQKTGETTLSTTVYAITVVRAAYIAPTFSGTISKSSTFPGTITFSSSDFTSKYLQNDGAALGSVVITGSNPSFGALRINGVAYTFGDSVSLSDITAGKLTFVPASNGTVSYTVNAYASGDTSAPVGTAILTIVVNNSTTAGTVNFSTYANTPLTLSATNFSSAFSSATGYTLSRVTFTLPASSYGTLYYNYVSASSFGSAVSAGTSYYSPSAPDYSSSFSSLSNVTFVPYAGYSGTVPITYTAYNADGSAFSGTLRITVTAPSAGTVSYSTSVGTHVTLNPSDFYTSFYNATGYALSNVAFTLPSSSYGTLYYNYTSPSSYSSVVAAGTRYYYSASAPYLSYVSFVPYSGYTGTVSIPYTAYNSSGAGYSGTLYVTVNGSNAGTVSFSTNKNTSFPLSSTNFNTAFSNATGHTLSYITLTQPSSSYGTLYYNYISATNYSSLVSAGTKYYRSSSPYISDVTFVPYTGFTGTITIPFTAYNSSGTGFSGTLEIKVNNATDSSRYFTDVGTGFSWAASHIDYLFEKGVVAGTSSGKYSPSAHITRGDFMLMLYRALDFSASASLANFSDVPVGSYYYNAIAVAKALGIAKGDNGYFNPNAPITREDAMVLVMRALNVSGNSIAAGSLSDLSSFYDKNTVSDYAQSAVGSLVRAKLVTGSDGYITPKGKMTRAEMAVLLYRILHL